MSDYWASPLQALGKGMGDCEDYSLAKYFSLVSMGMPIAKLRLVYVRAQIGGQSQAHMVLAYYPAPGAEPMILDNLVSEVRPASQRPDLEPVFSFNSEGLWQGVSGADRRRPELAPVQMARRAGACACRRLLIRNHDVLDKTSSAAAACDAAAGVRRQRRR